jgi:predicted Fe-Mo cluster-binding NifX family protein
MRIAIPTADQRVSPLFDVAKRLLVVDVEHDWETSRTVQLLDHAEAGARVRQISELGVHVLICGAITQPLQSMLLSAGVEVIPMTCGLTEKVLEAFLAGGLTGDAFVMPGCKGRRHRLPGRKECRQKGLRTRESRDTGFRHAKVQATR